MMSVQRIADALETVVEKAAVWGLVTCAWVAGLVVIGMIIRGAWEAFQIGWTFFGAA
jgi:hypothetical protein